ncbi:MAG TPA: hypothetical protein VGB50_04530 [Flavobacterium sp.]|jgi:hypothetical protein
MAAITDISSLERRISELEQQRDAEKTAIKAEVSDFLESLKPANLATAFLHSVRTSPELRSDILHGAVGLGTGFLTNKLLLNKFHGPFKSVVATLVQAGITNAAIKYPEEIKSKIVNVATKILQAMKFKTEPEINHEHTAGGGVL